ncbi:MAG: HAMP domain-containing histidine kinase [Polaromonas sp.]|nr:HAMP domain-containing histidine kinase [Polaromonas sp.]
MSLPLSSASKSPIKSDLMQDARVRAVIKENLYRGMLVRPIIVTATVIMFWYLLEVWPNNLRLMLALGIWGTNSILYLALHFYHRFQDMDKRQLPEASSMYLKLLVLNCWIDCAALGFVGLLITIERPDFESMVVIGLIMYMFSAFIKNISYATASRFLPALVFMPVTIAFLMRGDVAHIIIAVYFIISTFSLSVYGASAAAAIQLPIKQQYEIAKQNEALSQLTKQLSIERDRADAANAAKSHFFTAASHDARQPLQAISLLFDGFKMSSQTNLQDKKIIEKIEVNLNAIRHLFDRVLDISRIDSGHVTPEIKNFSLQKLFNKLDAQFGELAASKGLWLHFVPTAAWVEHDSELLDRIVSNLVHNAVKYTQTGGVWVAWRQARGRLEIRDSGIGISSGEQATIFNEFAQVNNPARNNDAGLGLGLSIVKRLAELTQTPFGLRSQKNMGSTFWLELNAKPLQNNLLNAQQTALNNFTKVPAAKMEKPLAGLTIFMWKITLNYATYLNNRCSTQVLLLRRALI